MIKKGILALFLLGAGLRAFAYIGEISVDAGPPAEPSPKKRAHSALWLHAKTRVTVLLQNAEGRRAGVEPQSHRVVQEIAGSSCQVDYIDNPYTGEARAEADERIALDPAAGGTYRLEIFGLQPGPFEISVAALANNGSSQPSKEIEGLISEGERKSFYLRFNPSPNSALTVVENP